MITEEIAVEMVAAGGKWLDAHQPSNWYDRVSLDRLNMSSVNDCVLGQLYVDNPCGAAGYIYALEHLLDNSLEMVTGLGFCHVGQGGPGHFGGYNMLTVAWKDYIIGRRVADLGTAGVHTVELAGV